MTVINYNRADVSVTVFGSGYIDFIAEILCVLREILCVLCVKILRHLNTKVTKEEHKGLKGNPWERISIKSN